MFLGKITYYHLEYNAPEYCTPCGVLVPAVKYRPVSYKNISTSYSKNLCRMKCPSGEHVVFREVLHKIKSTKQIFVKVSKKV